MEEDSSWDQAEEWALWRITQILLGRWKGGRRMQRMEQTSHEPWVWVDGQGCLGRERYRDSQFCLKLWLKFYWYCSVAQSCLTLWDPVDAACQAPLSSTISRSLFKFMFTESVMPSNHLNSCHPLLLLPPIFPSIRVFLMSRFFASGDFPGGSDDKAAAYNVGDSGLIPGLGRSSEKEMATHSSTLAWIILRMEEHGRLQSMGSQRVGHDWVTSLSLFHFLRIR